MTLALQSKLVSDSTLRAKLIHAGVVQPRPWGVWKSRTEYHRAYRLKPSRMEYQAKYMRMWRKSKKPARLAEGGKKF